MMCHVGKTIGSMYLTIATDTESVHDRKHDDKRHKTQDC